MISCEWEVGKVGDEDGFIDLRKLKMIQLLLLKRTAPTKVKSIAREMLLGITTGRKQTETLQRAIDNILGLVLILQSSYTFKLQHRKSLLRQNEE